MLRRVSRFWLDVSSQRPDSPGAFPQIGAGLSHSVRGSRHSTNALIAMKSLADRFFAKVTKGPSCWEWTGSDSGTGYGKIRVGCTMKRAHRVSYEIHCGEVPEGFLVCHSCDNRRCVNPEHLFLGTQADNIADMFAKGRKITKLSQSDALAIRSAVGVSQRHLAERYGVTQQHISNIRAGL